MADTTTGVQVFVGPANQLELGDVVEGPTGVTLETISPSKQRINFSISAPTAELVTATQEALDAATAQVNAAGVLVENSAAAAGAASTHATDAAASANSAASSASTSADAATTAAGQAADSAAAAAAAETSAADAAAAAGGGGFAVDPLNPNVLIISTRVDGSIAVDPANSDVLIITA